MSKEPKGGLGRCPNPTGRAGNCGCKEPCAVCGYPKHSAIHMHLYGGKPGDMPYGHEFVALKEREVGA